MGRVILFWDSPGFRIGDVTSDTEVAGPFADLHAAWLEAHNSGRRVVDVQRTRGTFKAPKFKQLALPVPPEAP